MIRVVNRLLAFVLGAALAVGGVLVVIEAVATWTNSGFVWIDGGSWLASFESTAWSDPVVITFSVVAAVAGLLLLLAQLKPRRARTVPFVVEGDTEWILVRRSTEAHLSRRMAAQVPATPIRASLKPGVRRWTLKVSAKAAPATAVTLEQAGRTELEGLHAPAASRVRVKTTGSPR